MTQPKQSSHNPSSQAPNQSFDSDVNTGFLFLFGGFFLYIIFLLLAKYLAIVAPYVYYPFVMPVYAFANSGVQAASIVGIYAAITFGLAFILPKKGKLQWGAFSYGVVFTLVALIELIFFRKASGGAISPLTYHVSAFCDPAAAGVAYIASCQRSVDDLNKIGIFNIIMLSLVPNIILGTWGINTAVRNFWLAAKHPKSKAKKSIKGVNELINEVAPLQPHLQIYKDFDPNLADPHSGQMRLMDTPRRYCFENDLIAGFYQRPKKASPDTYKAHINTSSDRINPKITDYDEQDYVPMLDTNKFEQAMLSQLGEVFTSIDALTATQKVVLALTLPLACRADPNMSADDAKALLKATEKRCGDIFYWVAQDIQKSHDDNLGFARFDQIEEYEQIIEQWMDDAIAKEIFSAHAYVNTILLRCLANAKKLGVFQPSNFTWLMFYDRSLYALIQNEGRPSVFSENAAAPSHFHVEKKAGRMIHSPQLQIAYDGFMENLHYYRYTKKQIDAWLRYKQTGDAEDMIKLNLVSKDFI